MMILCLLSLLLEPAVHEIPQLRLNAEEELLVGLPRLVLEHEKIAEQIDSGLTVSFVYLAELKRPEAENREGRCRVDVRFEPWDEVYEVLAVDFRGRISEFKFASRAALIRWFIDAYAGVADCAGLDEAVIRVVLDVRLLPFSSREQSETKDWFNRSLSGGNSTSALSGNLGDFLLSTSIKRKSLMTFYWNLEFRP